MIVMKIDARSLTAKITSGYGFLSWLLIKGPFLNESLFKVSFNLNNSSLVLAWMYRDAVSVENKVKRTPSLLQRLFYAKLSDEGKLLCSRHYKTLIWRKDAKSFRLGHEKWDLSGWEMGPMAT